MIGVAVASSLAALRFKRWPIRPTARRGRTEAAVSGEHGGHGHGAAGPEHRRRPAGVGGRPGGYQGWEWLHFNSQLLDDARAVLGLPAQGRRHLPARRNHTASPRIFPDGKRIAAASLEPGTVVWDSATGRGAGVLPGQGHNVRDMAFGPDGHLLAFSADGALVSWDLSRNVRNTLCRIPEEALAGQLLSPDGRLLPGREG